MPIIDVHLVLPDGSSMPDGLALTLANAAAAELGARPGSVWVRLMALPGSHYAENGSEVGVCELPAFVTVLHAQLPLADTLAIEAIALTRAIAACIGRPPDRVHIEYAPKGAGRIAFGGYLVR